MICNSVLDHMLISDAQETVARIGRTLVPGGVAYLTFDAEHATTPSRGAPLKRNRQDD